MSNLRENAVCGNVVISADYRYQKCYDADIYNM